MALSSTVLGAGSLANLLFSPGSEFYVISCQVSFRTQATIYLLKSAQLLHDRTTGVAVAQLGNSG